MEQPRNKDYVEHSRSVVFRQLELDPLGLHHEWKTSLERGRHGGMHTTNFFHTCVGVARKVSDLSDSTAVRIHGVWKTNASSHFVLWCAWTCPILMLCVQDPVLPVASIAVGPSV